MSAAFTFILRSLFLSILFLQVLLAQAPSPPVLFSEPLSPRNANYDIKVALNTDNGELQAQQILTWKNTANIATQELQLHLYLNGFRNNRSTFMQGYANDLKDTPLPSIKWGYIDINRLHLLPAPATNVQQYYSLIDQQSSTAIPGTDLSAATRFIQPDIPAHTEDKSVISVALPTAVAPGESISLYLDFSAKLPTPALARTGFKEEYFLVAQWFPKIGVFSDAGWNCHQFHSNSEFFADFGVYNVWMTVPSENLLGATGIIVGEPLDNGDGTSTHFYHAEDVHDFAWTTSPEFLEFKGQAQDVEIRALIQSDHREQGPRHIEAARAAIEYFQDRYGDYPFPNLTIVDPRRNAIRTSGMEYPTFFTARTFYGAPEGLHRLEEVIIHEFGHNYFQHMLASNEFEETWLDEGITSYLEMLAMNDIYGPEGDMLDLLGIKINNHHVQRAGYLWTPDTDPIVRNAWEYYSSGSYGINSYSRPAVMLYTLHKYLDDSTMQAIIRTYVERWRFKHPKSQDFIDIVNEISGKNMQRFFDQALYDNAILDYTVDRIFTRPFQPATGRDYTNSMSSQSFDPTDLSATLVSDTSDINEYYYSEVHLRRLGEFIFPVEVEMVFEDGSIRRETWDGESLWHKFSYTLPVRLQSASIDPENKIVLDLNFTNNSKAITPSSLGKNKLSMRWLFWMQFILDQPEYLNIFSIFL